MRLLTLLCSRSSDGAADAPRWQRTPRWRCSSAFSKTCKIKERNQKKMMEKDFFMQVFYLGQKHCWKIELTAGETGALQRDELLKHFLWRQFCLGRCSQPKESGLPPVCFPVIYLPPALFSFSHPGCAWASVPDEVGALRRRMLLPRRFHLLSAVCSRAQVTGGAAVHKQQTVEVCTSRRCRQVKTPERR